MSQWPAVPRYRRVLEFLEKRNETRSAFESALASGNPFLLAMAAPPYVAVLRELEVAVEGWEDSPAERARRDECLTLEEKAALDGFLQEQQEIGDDDWELLPSVVTCAQLEEHRGG